MSGNLLGVSITGLRVSQSALSTTGHNIANAGTEGYSRQRVDPVTNPAVKMGNGFVGNGANVSSIDRIANSFVTGQLRIDTSLSADLTAFFNQTSQLDNLLSNDATGLTGALQSFFAAMQNGTDDPTSIPARQLIVSEAENLADRFNSIDARLNVLKDGVQDSLKVGVAQVNALTKTIAQLNLRIGDAQGLSATSEPNDLLDQRDEALRKLAKLVPVQTFDQGQGQLNVLVAGGLSLVVGTDAHTLSLETGRTAGTVADLVLQDGKGGRVVTQSIKGGEVGGLLRFRDEHLANAFNSLGRVATVLADSFNQLHQKGITPENEFGSLFFNDINEPIAVRQRVVSSSQNAQPSDRQLNLFIRDVGQVSTSNYTLEVRAGGVYKITRENDNAEVATGLLTGDFPFSVNFDGLELEFVDGSFTTGDSFELQPLTNGARDFSRVIVNPEDIAFASPLLTDAEIGNIGSGKITAGEVLSLTDAAGNPLPPFANSGQMSPPMVIVFTSPTSYDVLDNTDPAHPAQLNPPIRNQRFIPGINNPIFPTVDGQKQLTMKGDLIGLPEGRVAVTQAAVKPPFINLPSATTGLSLLDFSTTDFSGANQFSFDVQLSDTPLGAKDSLTTVTLDSTSITTETQLLSHINNQLSVSGVRAYIAIDAAGNHSLAFRAAEAGYANVSVQNYAGPANGTANALFNIDIESGALYTSSNNLNGTEGAGILSNGYPSEKITITQAPLQAGLQGKSYTVFNDLHSSAKVLASQLSNIPGVEANAFTYAQISDFNVGGSAPLQISLNGKDLLEYRTDGITGDKILSPIVPNPVSDEAAFNDYLANVINDDANFKKLGITAVAGQNPLSGAFELRVKSAQGDDLKFGLIAGVGQSIAISDGEHNPVNLVGSGNDDPSQVVVGGQMDIRLAADMSLSTRPPVSLLFGDTQADDFEVPTYLGLSVTLSGAAKTGDRFTIDFNHNAASDNRNALGLIGIESQRILNGGTASITDAYGTLVETVGISTNSAKINSEAAEAVLEQTTKLRDSISGVNLDEEAANLIRYEQFFQANAQVITVARNLFDTLINSF